MDQLWPVMALISTIMAIMALTRPLTGCLIVLLVLMLICLYGQGTIGYNALTGTVLGDTGW